MNGELDINKALEARLSIMNLNVKKLTDFLDNHPVRLTPGVENLVNQFKENGIDVYLVSGGSYPLVSRVAELLNIPEENVYANKLIFNNEGFVLMTLSRCVIVVCQPKLIHVCAMFRIACHSLKNI
ncbi:putative phosphoserine phosphatase [Schistosoma mansoni]|uniref:putative phosphoserine phosphatase n=1 Tax=Schistosoma mansoni TaxID=6183 RepID=UPI00022DBF06|nr:putative phosphoserine phosphatase [Schistosoma mansoni]|eukprot:XP_018651200.1 putative phosphoserine phosphatase [Schistosoma mansoni]